MVRNSGENPFDPEERRVLRKIVPRVGEIIEVVDNHTFRKRLSKTINRVFWGLIALMAGLGTSAGAVLAIKEFIKRVIR